MGEAQEGVGVTAPVGTNDAAAAETVVAEAPEVYVDVKPAPVHLPAIMLATIGVLSVLLVAYLAYRLLPVILLLFVSLLFATAIEPVVNWLRRGPFNRSAGILIVYTGL